MCSSDLELVHHPYLDTSQGLDRPRVEAWLAALAARFAGEGRSGDDRYTFHVREDEERHQPLPAVDVLSHGVSTSYVLSREFLASGEYREIAALGATLSGLIEADGYVRRGDREHPATDFGAALEFLMAEARKGYGIQRYKEIGRAHV